MLFYLAKARCNPVNGSKDLWWAVKRVWYIQPEGDISSSETLILLCFWWDNLGKFFISKF
jgi:hypothetical protein